MNCKAVVFDLDGTLVDSLADIACCANQVLREHRLPEHPLDAYRRFVGDGLAMMLTRALPERYALEAPLSRFRELYGATATAQTRPYPGILEMLDGLTGGRTAVLSNKADDLTSLVVYKLFGPDAFDVVMGVRPEVRPKPHSDMLLALARTLRIAPQDIMMVGDSPHDMALATAAGAWPVGVSWGFRPVEELMEAGAACVVHDPMEVAALARSGHR